MEKRNYLNGNEPWRQNLLENHEILHDFITKEIFWSLRMSALHIKLPFVILGDHDTYRIGVYMDGKCRMKIRNLQLIKGDYHGQYYGDEVL